MRYNTIKVTNGLGDGVDLKNEKLSFALLKKSFGERRWRRWE